MSIEYYGVCHDCKEYIDLYKFGDWANYDVAKETSYPSDETISGFNNYHFIFKTLRLHSFMDKHPGHRLQVSNFDEFWDSGQMLSYSEVYKWPIHGRK